MKKFFMAIMNEVVFLVDNDVQYMNVDFPSECNPYCHITLMTNNHHEKAILLENYLHDKQYIKTVDCNKWLEFQSYSFMYNSVRIVYTIKGYRNTI